MDNFDEYQRNKESKRVFKPNKSDNIKRLAKYFCERCQQLFVEPDFKYSHDGIITFRYKVCPNCKCSRINKLKV